jgi:hypothetical protein
LWLKNLNCSLEWKEKWNLDDFQFEFDRHCRPTFRRSKDPARGSRLRRCWSEHHKYKPLKTFYKPY